MVESAVGYHPMIIATGGEDGKETFRTALQQIEERRCVIQEETYKEHSERVFFVFIDHE